jgi:hypothetical protein
MAWHSGSPKRQLNSTTRGPSLVIMIWMKSTPAYGAPSLAMAASTGAAISSITRRLSASSRAGTGAYTPMPPVIGPRSSSKTVL